MAPLDGYNHTVMCRDCRRERPWLMISASHHTAAGVSFICSDCFYVAPTMWQRIKQWFREVSP